MNEYRKQIRAAMKWWRAANPERSPYARMERHGWYGHALMGWDRGERGVIMTARELLDAHAVAEHKKAVLTNAPEL